MFRITFYNIVTNQFSSIDNLSSDDIKIVLDTDMDNNVIYSIINVNAYDMMVESDIDNILDSEVE